MEVLPSQLAHLQSPTEAPSPGWTASSPSQLPPTVAPPLPTAPEPSPDLD
ncbi:hypothetical protein EST38_g8059 [Candolleomyces aberdarensis]|uniref:Uncharacterized protein n=1 Tax=Candolleomyces aberdarensis TaxID=2316362 RepID=A0A4Q2DFD3_9AGAR|nr:hypothetical protein EST38_g8059 [Candolleomyces aberdarensis]